MNKEAAYMIYCLERYRHAKGLSGREAVALFKRHGVMHFVQEFFPLLHIQSDSLTIEEIDRYIATGQ